MTIKPLSPITIFVVLAVLINPFGNQLISLPRMVDTAENETLQQLVIPTAAFTPYEDSLVYINSGDSLIHLPSPEQGIYVAPVHLPHGATIARLASRWITRDGIGHATLYRRQYTSGISNEMAAVTSESYTSGIKEFVDDTVNYSVVDNQQFAYWIVVMLSPNGVVPLPHGANLYGVVLDYKVSVQPQAGTEWASIPAAAFLPAKNGYNFDRSSQSLQSNGPEGAKYIAQLSLPHTATIKKVTVYFQNTSAGELSSGIKLHQVALGKGDEASLAELSLALPGGYVAATDESITNPLVNNLQYAYWLSWIPSSPEILLLGVVVEYSAPPAGSPLVISLSAAAFRPTRPAEQYENQAITLKHQAGSTTSDNRGEYIAPVYLPCNGEETRARIYYVDNRGDVNASFFLNCTNSNVLGSIESVDTQPLTWTSSTYTQTLSHQVQSQSIFAHWLLPTSPSESEFVWGGGMVFEYKAIKGEELRYLPLVSK